MNPDPTPQASPRTLATYVAVATLTLLFLVSPTATAGQTEQNSGGNFAVIDACVATFATPCDFDCANGALISIVGVGPGEANCGGGDAEASCTGVVCADGPHTYIGTENGGTCTSSGAFVVCTSGGSI